MSKRSDYQEEMTERLDLWSARLDSLLTRATAAEKVAFHAEVDKWKAAGVAAFAKLAELKDSTGDNWEVVNEEMGTIWQAIAAALDKAEFGKRAKDEAKRDMSLGPHPLLIEFAPGTRIHREPNLVPKLPIVQNGPPGTSVVFADGTKVPLPTDQITFAEDARGAARVGFGGMSFEGMAGPDLVFFRVRDLQPEELLSPERGRRMTLDPRMVASIAVDGRVVWTRL